MPDPVAALADQQDELLALVRDLGAGELLAPTRCEGWTVADVLLHLAQTNEMAVASVEGRLGSDLPATAPATPAGDVDAWAAAVVDAERTDPAAARDRFVASCADQVTAFRRCDPSERVQWVAGTLAARTLATTRLSECWIHTVDVATALGPEPEPTDRLWHICRLAWRTLPYAFEQAGRHLGGDVAFDLDAPGGGGRWRFGGDDAATVVTGTARDLCTVAGQRADAADTSLEASGPAAADVLALVRTFA